MIHKELVLYNITPSICKWDTHNNHLEELAHYKTVKLVQIMTYEDKNYLKGITFSYLCDGWITEVKSYFPEQTLCRGSRMSINYIIKSIDFNENQYVKSIKGWRSKFL